MDERNTAEVKLSWSEGVHEDHRTLVAEAQALDAALSVDITPQDRRVVLGWIVRTLWPALELHLRKEEEVLFPALEKLLGKEAGALTLLKEQNGELRLSHRRLAELIQPTENLSWEAIRIAVGGFLELLEDHEKKVERLLIDVLEFNLSPKELKGLAEAFYELARKAHEEEGWPIPPWGASRHSKEDS
jgi:iron-sulfur cluster repair protein YtfE (RIC family)